MLITYSNCATQSPDKTPQKFHSGEIRKVSTLKVYCTLLIVSSDHVVNSQKIYHICTLQLGYIQILRTTTYKEIRKEFAKKKCNLEYVPLT